MSAKAIEPNEDMRLKGVADSQQTSINSLSGSAEATGLHDKTADWITMASSFHWANFTAATNEFHRVLRQESLFTALWNSRLIAVNPLLVEIELHLHTLQLNMERVFFGRSGITETLTEQLWSSPYFKEVAYAEVRHVIPTTPKHYLAIWRSGNDINTQLGPNKFNTFTEFVEKRITGLKVIEAYLTCSWSAERNN